MRHIELSEAMKHLSGADESGKPKAIVKVMHYHIETDKKTGEQISSLVDKIVETNVKAAIDIQKGKVVVAAAFNDYRNYEKCADLIEAANEKRANGYDVVFVKVCDVKTQQVCVEMQLSNCMMMDAQKVVMFVAELEDMSAYIEEDDRGDNTLTETSVHQAITGLFTQFSSGEEAVVTLQHHRADNGRAVNEAKVLTKQLGLRFHRGMFELTLGFDSFEDDGYVSFINLIDGLTAAYARDGYQSYGLRLFVTNKEKTQVLMFPVGHMKFADDVPVMLMMSPYDSVMAFNPNK